MFAVNETEFAGKSYREQIAALVGLDDKGYLQGVYVLWSLKELRAKRNSWDTLRTVHTGRWQLNLTVPGESRVRVFRTNKHGKFDLDAIKAGFEQAASLKRQAVELEANRNTNQKEAEILREKYKNVGRRRFISSYAGPDASYVAGSILPGKVCVQLNFGHVTPEVAEKILAFAQSLEG